MARRALMVCLMLVLVMGYSLAVSEKMMGQVSAEADPKKGDKKGAPAKADAEKSAKPAKGAKPKQGQPTKKKQAVREKPKKANGKKATSKKAGKDKKNKKKPTPKKKAAVKPKKQPAKPKPPPKPKPILDPAYEMVEKLDKKTGKKIKFIRKKRDPIKERKRNQELQALIKKTEAKLTEVNKKLSKYSDQHFYNHLQNELGHLLNSVHYEGNLEVKVKKQLPRNPLDIKVEMMHNLRGKTIDTKRVQSVIDLMPNRGARKSQAELQRELLTLETHKQPGGHVGREKAYVPDSLRYAKFKNLRSRRKAQKSKKNARKCGKKVKCKKHGKQHKRPKTKRPTATPAKVLVI